MTMFAPILAVDDDPHMRRLIGRLLVEEGLETKVASSAESALAALKSESFSLLVLDVVMDGETGFDLARRIRAGEAGERHRSLPILFVTAEADEQSYETSFDVGAHGYVTKPFKGDDLLGRVRSLMSMAA